MQIYAPKDGGNVSIGGVTIKVVAGKADVDGPIAAQLVEQFGFTYEPPGSKPAAADVAASSSPDSRVLVFPNSWTSEQIAEFRRQFDDAVLHGDLPQRIRPPEPLAQVEPQPQPEQPAPQPQASAAETGDPAKVEPPVVTYNE